MTNDEKLAAIAAAFPEASSVQIDWCRARSLENHRQMKELGYWICDYCGERHFQLSDLRKMVEMEAVREWAQLVGMDNVPARGRVPNRITDAYLKATGLHD